MESANDLGSFSIEATNSTGITTIDIVEGDWIVSLNYTVAGKRWVIENHPITITVGDNHVDLQANLYVALTGTVFWDLNDNNASNVGEGISDVFEEIVKKLPPPKGFENLPLKAILVDSWYDTYLGVVVLIRVHDGIIKKGDKIKLMQTGANYTVDRLLSLIHI